MSDDPHDPQSVEEPRMGKGDLRDWARYFDPDWDADCDPPADVFCAWKTYETNLSSAVLALTGLPQRFRDQKRYDDCMRKLLDMPTGIKAFEFERLWTQKR